MAVTVTETPYMISWARNQNALTLLCTVGTLQNYAIAARVTVWVNNNNEVTERQSEVMVLHPDAQGYVRVPLDLLAGYIPQPDMPDGQEFALLTNAVMKYQVQYAEMYGSPTPTVRTWRTDSIRYVICGEVAERYARLNTPDWNSGMERPIVDSQDLFLVVGEDTGRQVTVRKSQPVYLYGLWYRAGSTSATLRVNVKITIVTASGQASMTRVYDVTSGSMYRLDVSPTVLEIEDALYYTIAITSSGGSWSRTFIIRPDGWKDRYLLLQSKYGVLTPWVCPGLKRELTIEAESLKVGRLHYNDTTDAYEKYTALLPMLTNEEARRLARCLGQQYHYIKSGYAWLRIVVEPETFTVLEEPEGMVRVQFAFRFVENQQENMSDAPRTAGMTFNYNDDVAQEYVTYNDRTIATNNELYD